MRTDLGLKNDIHLGLSPLFAGHDCPKQFDYPRIYHKYSDKS
jgi:hypothetical protein